MPGPWWEFDLIKVLIAVLGLMVATALPGKALEPDAKLRWSESFEGFGGYSAIAVLNDGARFIAISDRGSFAEGQLIRESGQLTGVEMERRGALLDPSGEPVSGYDFDAEGIAIGTDGLIYISFEANHRVWSYETLGSPAEELARVPDYGTLQNNSSLEALAIDRFGSLYTIPERSGELTRPFPVYVHSNGRWSTPYTIPRDGGPWLVSGADFGPDEQLYVLDRDFHWLTGFRNRIRRLTLGPSGFEDEEVVLETGFGDLDNMEGIAVWRDGDGATRITLISDDNLSFLQSTILVEYILDEPRKTAAPTLSVRPRPRQTPQ